MIKNKMKQTLKTIVLGVVITLGSMFILAHPTLYKQIETVHADTQTSQSNLSDQKEETGTVTYQFFDINTGEKIRDDETLTGKVGDAWYYDPRQHIHDYQMPNDVPFEGTYTNDPQVIKAFFTPAKDGSLTVRYKYSDEKDQVIRDTDSTKYAMWETFKADINKFQLEGWTINLNKSKYSIDFGDGNAIEVPLQQLIGTNSLADVVSQIQVTPGYELNETITFNLVYTRVSSNLTANYVDDGGNTIADSMQLSGLIGSQYSLNQKVIDGYTLKSVNGNTSGAYTDEDQTVTYVYEKNISESATEDNSGQTNKTDSAPNVRQNLTKTPKRNMTNVRFTNMNSALLPEVQQSDELPITGMKNTVWITLIGIVMILLSSIFLYRKRAKNGYEK